MIRRTSRNKILKELNDLKRAAPKDEPFIVWIKKIDDGKYQVEEYYIKGLKGVRDKKFNVMNPDEYRLQNPNVKCPIIFDDIDSSEEDATIVFNELLKIANEEEIDKMVDLFAESIESSDTPNKELSYYMHSLIKKYRHKIMETIGFESVDYSRLTVHQLKKLIYTIESSEK